MNFSFAKTGGDSCTVPLDAGQVIFVIGANGTGKSSLMHNLYIANRLNVRRVSAHRQIWFQTNAMDMTASTKKQLDQSLQKQDVQPNARWMDPTPAQRPTITIFELIDAENIRARKIAAAVDVNDNDTLAQLRKEPSPLTQLNELLKIANLSIEISIEKDEQLFASKDGSPPYEINQLSDGERNAMLIAASVLTARTGSLIIIDEPERHLHRSIVSPLLLSLFEKREDCGFVISTHDVGLPVDSPDSSTLLLRSCRWVNNNATWDADLLTPDATLPDDIKQSILGARRKILYVEGDHDSLDKHIYSIIYSTISVIPIGSCKNVEEAVIGIRNTASVNWVSAFGLVDRDDRDEKTLEGLATRGVFALDCYSVESLYYCDDIMQKIALRQTQVAPDLADLVAARRAIVDKILPHRDRLCLRLAQRKVRVAVSSTLPTIESLRQTPVHSVTFDATEIIAQEQERFDALTAASNTDGLVNRYPVRETGVLREVAIRLGFRNEAKYESAVRTLLIEDEEARNVIKQRISPLTLAIDA